MIYRRWATFVFFGQHIIHTICIYFILFYIYSESHNGADEESVGDNDDENDDDVDDEEEDEDDDDVNVDVDKYGNDEEDESNEEDSGDEVIASGT